MLSRLAAKSEILRAQSRALIESPTFGLSRETRPSPPACLSFPSTVPQASLKTPPSLACRAMAPRDSINIKSSPSSSGLTRSPSVASVGIPGSSSYRSLNIGRSSSSTSVATSFSHPKVRPMSPEELDSDRDVPLVPALPGKARKVVGKLSGVGVPDVKSKKAAAGGKTHLPSTPTSGSAASRRMTGTPAKSTKKAKAAAAGKEGGSKERVVVCVRYAPLPPRPC